MSLLSIIGLAGIFAILIFTLMTHVYGRIAGPTWVVLGLVAYMLYRKRQGAPVFGSLKRDWVKLHKRTLTSAGELEMLDEYRDAIALQTKAEPDADR